MSQSWLELADKIAAFILGELPARAVDELSQAMRAMDETALAEALLVAACTVRARVEGHSR